MDASSSSVAAFLESLQDAMKELGNISHHYLRRGTQPGRPFLVLSGRPFAIHRGDSLRQFHGSVGLGLMVTGADGKDYELGVDVLWDLDCWTLTTEAWVETKDGGQKMLRKLPERTATDLSACSELLAMAIKDLRTFEDLVPGSGSAA